MMHIFHYFIYQLRPYGMPADKRPATPEPPPDLNLTAFKWFAPKDDNTTLSNLKTNETNPVLTITTLSINSTLAQQNVTANMTQKNLTNTNLPLNFSNLTDLESTIEVAEKTNRSGIVNKLRSAIFG